MLLFLGPTSSLSPSLILQYPSLLTKGSPPSSSSSSLDAILKKSVESNITYSRLQHLSNISFLDWNVDDCESFVRDVVKLKEEHVKKLKAQDVDGKALFSLTEEKLMHDGLSRGAAIHLMLAIAELKTTKSHGLY